MAAPDPVPDADRQEQESPLAREERDDHPFPPDAPDADVFEQELPIAESSSPTGIDAERTEPVSGEDWESTGN